MECEAWLLQGIRHLAKSEKTCGLYSSTFKNVGRCETFGEDLPRCMSCGRRSTSASEMLGGQGGDFLRGVAFWSLRSSGLLR